jgi:hypothetical protein
MWQRGRIELYLLFFLVRIVLSQDYFMVAFKDKAGSIYSN